MQIVKKIKEEVKKECDIYIKSSKDKYDFWNEHIRYVYKEANILASRYKADKEIVLLGALLHDIALIKKEGNRAFHHINGAKIAKELLLKYNYPNDKLEKVLNTILHHRSSKEALNIEEICVCDADILSHFDNIPMIFDYAYKHNNVTIDNVKVWIKNYFEKDFNDLSSLTKEKYFKKYKNICKVLFNE